MSVAELGARGATSRAFVLKADVVDVKAARELGIPVSNIPTYGTASVAQFAVALLLELCQHVGLHSDAVRAGEWSRNKDWCFWHTPLVELAGKTMGVVGFGRIGREGKIADARARVLATPCRPIRRHTRAWMGRIGGAARESDASPHCPFLKPGIDQRAMTAPDEADGVPDQQL
jgi:glycerate dehydrogenase